MDPRSRSFRPAVMLKDNRTCQYNAWCKMKGPRPESELDADHIIPRWKKGADDAETNGQVLCKPHHKKKTAKEAGERAGKGITYATILHSLILFVAFGYAIWRVLNWMWLSYSAPVTATYYLQESIHRIVGALVFAAIAHFIIVAAPKWYGSAATDATVSEKDDPMRARIIVAARSVMGSTAEVFVTPAKNGEYGLKYAGTGFRASKAENRAALEDEVGAACGGRWRGRWDTTSDYVWLSALEELPDSVPHPGFAKSRPWWLVPVGVSAAGEVFFNFKKTAHILVCGLTGSGKTGFLHTVISGLADSASRGEIERLVICDPKRISVLEWEGQPGITQVATSPEQLWDAPTEFAVEVQRRYDEHEKWIRSGGTTGTNKDDNKPWVLLVDEYEEFTVVMTEHAAEEMEAVDASGNVVYAKNMPVMTVREKTLLSRPATPIRAVARSARLAREAGMHIILLTQRGDADLMGGRVRNNFGGRVLLGRGGVDESKMCFGVATYGRNVPAIPGRMTIQNGESEPFEAQCYMTSKPEYRSTKSRLDSTLETD